jgi:hypothetical protein
VPVRAFERVKNVPPQGAQFWNRRVIEITVVGHSDLFHDSPRTSIRLHSECDHCVKVELAKTKLQRCKRAFSGQSLTPKRGMRRYKSSTAGANGMSGGTHFRPRIPAKSPRTSRAHGANPWVSQCCSMRVISPKDSSGVRSPGKYFLTPGSRFISTNPRPSGTKRRSTARCSARLTTPC